MPVCKQQQQKIYANVKVAFTVVISNDFNCFNGVLGIQPTTLADLFIYSRKRSQLGKKGKKNNTTQILIVDCLKISLCYNLSDHNGCQIFQAMRPLVHRLYHAIFYGFS